MTLDFYLLVETRSTDKALSFLDKFLPNRKVASIDFPFPQYADRPSNTFVDPLELMDYLSIRSSDSYSIYWNNIEEEHLFSNAMLFYTDDGKLIFGLSFDSELPIPEEKVSVLQEVIQFLDPQKYCLTAEEPPPENSVDFLEFSDSRMSLE